MMRQFCLALFCAFIVTAGGNQRPFSVSDDVFAYPQYTIDFIPAYILDADANEILDKSSSSVTKDDTNVDTDRYERLILNDQVYLCAIPQVESTSDTTEESLSEEDQRKELIRAADRGWELLKDMEDKQCLYYSTGWWSYSFCYNTHVKQFHALQPGAAAFKVWPPREDPDVPSFFLGRFDEKNAKKTPGALDATHSISEPRETSYLVQRLDSGTLCDLTGEDRTIEIQFHCHPQSTDHIGWIKETATCSYLMVVYTPRLCNDVAFQPAKGSQAQKISCQQILNEAGVDALEKVTTGEEPLDQAIMLGNIELGARKHVGREGKRIEKGRIVMTVEERAEIVMMQKDGRLQGLSRSELKKLSLNPETVEKFRKELQEMAGSKDWKIERLDADGQIKLRGVVSDEEEKQHAESGSEEEAEKDDL